MTEEHVDNLGDVSELPDVPDSVDEVQPEQGVGQGVESGHLLGGLEGDVEVWLAQPVGTVEEQLCGRGAVGGTSAGRGLFSTLFLLYRKKIMQLGKVHFFF